MPQRLSDRKNTNIRRETEPETLPNQDSKPFLEFVFSSESDLEDARQYRAFSFDGVCSNCHTAQVGDVVRAEEAGRTYFRPATLALRSSTIWSFHFMHDFKYDNNYSKP